VTLQATARIILRSSRSRRRHRRLWWAVGRSAAGRRGAAGARSRPLGSSSPARHRARQNGASQDLLRWKSGRRLCQLALHSAGKTTRAIIQLAEIDTANPCNGERSARQADHGQGLDTVPRSAQGSGRSRRHHPGHQRGGLYAERTRSTSSCRVGVAAGQQGSRQGPSEPTHIGRDILSNIRTSWRSIRPSRTRKASRVVVGKNATPSCAASG